MLCVYTWVDDGNRINCISKWFQIFVSNIRLRKFAVDGIGNDFLMRTSSIRIQTTKGIKLASRWELVSS